MNAEAEPLASEQEEDTPNIRKVLIIAIGTAIAFAIGIVWVIVMMASMPRRPGRLLPPVPRSLGRPEIGIVDQPMFEGDQRLRRLLDEQRKRLTDYGWVDRDAGVVHIPIDRAMDRILTGAGR